MKTEIREKFKKIMNGEVLLFLIQWSGLVDISTDVPWSVSCRDHGLLGDLLVVVPHRPRRYMQVTPFSRYNQFSELPSVPPYKGMRRSFFTNR